ncbi:hypothetical protein RF11_04831 [Thelohanellus kitauei]|uniref:ISXO2-like transposase domain-containing protein n=1 Tax=Thelohanellus kitauei TaxID=669202 RepID=A0A0C2MM35_THEKT|nr:hypothetical protein RF11_04831 [Thelohanellus kitauei]
MCSEICIFKLLEFSMNPDFRLGGEGFTVKIREAKFGRRKYHRGKKVKGVWVFGGIQRKTNEVSSRALLSPVPDRSRENLFAIIQRWIEPGISPILNEGTTIVSDGWASYLGLNEIGYQHLAVNHSETFVDT